MKPTKKSKKESQAEVWEKNYFLYFDTLLNNPHVTGSILKIQAKWGLPDEILIETETDTSRFNNNPKLVIKEATENLNALKQIHGYEGVNEFQRDLRMLAVQLGLGLHWIDCLAYGLLTGTALSRLIIPPAQTFGAPNLGESIKKGSITIEIGPHTTINELRGYLSTINIEAVQKNVWPNANRKKISRKSIANQKLILESIHKKYSPGEYKYVADKNKNFRYEYCLKDYKPTDESAVISSLGDDISEVDKTKAVGRLKQARCRTKNR
jgi:hypothetical protein